MTMLNRSLLIFLFLLGGCSTLVDSYLMKFDSNEYQTISNIRTTAQLAKEKCDNPDVASDSYELYA